MKQLIIILLGLIGVAYGQSQPTSAKTRFVNGIYLGTKLDSYFAAADSNAIYWRADSVVMAKYKGTARALAFAVSGGYLPISDTAAMLAPFIQYSDTTGLFSNVVRTFGTQTIGGSKTFSNDITVNGLTVGKGAGSDTANTAFGVNALRFNSGQRNTSIGHRSLQTNFGGGNNTALGFEALYSINSGGTNTALGSSAMYLLRSGGSNTAVGYLAGNFGLPNQIRSGNNSIFLGAFTKPLDTANTNEIVIGYDATGNGSNTVTIGNSSVTGNYFNGFLKQTSVTSALVKASSTGVLEAAVAGTDYVAPSALSGYLPLSGGTLTGALNGTSLSMSGAGSFGGDVGIGTASPSGIGRVINGYGGTGINSNLVLEGNAGASFISILSSATVGVGSSIFAKEGIRFAKATAKDATGFTEQMRLETDGALLINTTTTDGVHKLIVNGGVKGGDINITGTSNLIGNVTIGTTATPADAVLNLASNASGTPRSIIYSQSTAFLNFTSTTGANVFQISNGGAITASSSVTANSFVKSGGASTEALMANGSVQTVSSSTYTPTLTGTTNITSVTLDKASYIRVGNFVTVTVYGTVQTTASGASDFTISLPFTAGGTAPMSGSGTVANLGIDSRAMFAQSSSLTAIKYYWDSPNTTLKTFSVTFQFGL